MYQQVLHIVFDKLLHMTTVNLYGMGCVLNRDVGNYLNAVAFQCFATWKFLPTSCIHRKRKVTFIRMLPCYFVAVWVLYYVSHRTVSHWWLDRGKVRLS